jgi:hypothetical protein
LINCYLWEQGCQIDWSNLAAWVQAFASVGAIWWAGKFASNQAAMQYKNTLRLKSIEDRQRAIGILTTIKALIEAVASSSDELQKVLETGTHNNKNLKEAAETLLADISAEAEKLEAIPMFELPTAALEAVLVLQRLGRQRQRHVKRFSEENYFTNFEDTDLMINELKELSDTQRQLCETIEIAISRVIEDTL